jgi:hypothetical protein
MTIEVKELTINATVMKNLETRREEEEGGGAGLSELDRNQIISNCVEQVLNIINGSRER